MDVKLVVYSRWDAASIESKLSGLKAELPVVPETRAYHHVLKRNRWQASYSTPFFVHKGSFRLRLAPFKFCWTNNSSFYLLGSFWEFKRYLNLCKLPLKILDSIFQPLHSNPYLLSFLIVVLRI